MRRKDLRCCDAKRRVDLRNSRSLPYFWSGGQVFANTFSKATTICILNIRNNFHWQIGALYTHLPDMDSLWGTGLIAVTPWVTMIVCQDPVVLPLPASWPWEHAGAMLPFFFFCKCPRASGLGEALGTAWRTGMQSRWNTFGFSC